MLPEYSLDIHTAALTSQTRLFPALWRRELVTACMQAQFYGLLNEFLNSTAGTDSIDNIVFADNGTILTSQLGFAHTASYNQVQLMPGLGSETW